MMPKGAVSGTRKTSPYFSPSSLSRRMTTRATTAIATLNLVASSTLTAASPALVSPVQSHRMTATFLFDQPVTPSSPSDRSEKRPLKKKKSPGKARKANIPTTTSFGPLCHARFVEDGIEPVKVHTLILGTHPSIKSFEEEQYFGHPLNAFWWIAGDCLGFRRATGISPSTGKQYELTKFIRHGEDRIIPYGEQTKELVKNGFALWDIVSQCERPGSLDQDIKNAKPNNLREFAQEHYGTLRRIVIANGGTGCTLFVRLFKDWLGSGELQALPGHEPSEKAFSKAIEREERRQNIEVPMGHKKIDLICAIGVSPAAAKYSYEDKRSMWEQYVYEPGLADFALQNSLLK